MESKSFGVRLTELLQQKRLTQKELAHRVGITEAAVSHYIKGDRVPRSTVLARIAAELDTTSDYLLEGTPETVLEEIGYAKRLIARNASQLSAAEKREIINILLGDDQ